MNFRLSFLLIFVGNIIFYQANAGSNIIGKELSYTANGITMIGYVAYDDNIKGKRPGILVVHEWWGCNDYVKQRARMLADLGYIAFAIDMYRDGRVATDPAKAREYAMPFYDDPELAKERIEAALTILQLLPETNTDKIAAVGYCFGGSMVLNMAKMGMDFKGVVSFHGRLKGVPAAPYITRAKILVCHGEADQSVSAEDVVNFKQNLDSMKVSYQFKSYPNATHAFSNPDATATGIKFGLPIQYNEEADKKSWEDMKLFLNKIFQ